MKYLEYTYWAINAIALGNWLLSTVGVASKIAALVVTIITIFYLNEKRKGQKLDNKLKQKQLDDGE